MFPYDDKLRLNQNEIEIPNFQSPLFFPVFFLRRLPKTKHELRAYIRYWYELNEKK